MNPDVERFVRRRVVYRLPAMQQVTVLKDVAYTGAGGEALAMDIYRPPDSQRSEAMPAVLFVIGYPDPGMRRIFGCPAKDIGAYVSWAELVAASGMVGVTYTNGNPVEDLGAALRHLSDQASTLGIDRNRLGIWACSGNVPNALSLLIEEPGRHLKCAALNYGYMFEFDGFTGVRDAARTFGFSTPSVGRRAGDLPHDLPIFVSRAGSDEMPGLNRSLDRFVSDALAENLPLTVVNHHHGPHAFDTADDSAASRDIIRQILTFFHAHLAVDRR
jgi:acetyl esterase/lipase